MAGGCRLYPYTRAPSPQGVGSHTFNRPLEPCRGGSRGKAARHGKAQGGSKVAACG